VSHSLRLLPARGERPCSCRTAEKVDELAPLSITSSATFAAARLAKQRRHWHIAGDMRLVLDTNVIMK
jgi:hypothetical protein